LGIKTQQYFLQQNTDYRVQICLKIKKIIKLHQPDMVIAERTTSYGFLAAYRCKTNSNSTTGAEQIMAQILFYYQFKKIQIMHSKMQP
jgi:hypothetical protein